ncbi:hypothetical protein [Pararcticibacter amylolyticus]|uniref:Outer membrane protein beta-barrel domain-containing protein n=1 Tax=Pararcticibacter amylolyticus TaxID=2173175 RepID=A0A2U2PBE1_9SPHI|nr:hypothetical protein [Pararcticibacter amylolyticus]PWG78702.1 hypothetical protein DDR33_21005 [Pararcticibacter amylolyticus]
MSTIKFTLFTLTILAFLNTNVKAQAPISRAQNVFVELGGPGLLVSANYDTRFTQKRDGIGGRLGAGYMSVDNSSLFTLPLQANYLLGKEGKYFEIGLGATYINLGDDDDDDFLSFDSSSSLIGTMTFGYRYQPETSGFSFRASINPIFNKSGFIPYFAGISLGYAF